MGPQHKLFRSKSFTTRWCCDRQLLRRACVTALQSRQGLTFRQVRSTDAKRLPSKGSCSRMSGLLKMGSRYLHSSIPADNCYISFTQLTFDSAGNMATKLPQQRWHRSGSA